MSSYSDKVEENFSDINNGWNDYNEKLVVSLGERAAGFKWMHEQCNYKYALLNKINQILVILVTSVLSAQTALGESSSNECEFNIIQKILVYIISFLTIFGNFLKFEESSIKHIRSSKDYTNLYHDIQQQMCNYRKDRPPGSIYLTSKLKKFDNIRVASPDIDASIIRKFKKKYTSADFAMPDVADTIKKINVINEEELGCNNTVDTSIIIIPNTVDADTDLIDEPSSNLCFMNTIVNKSKSFDTKELLKQKAMAALQEYEMARNN